MKRKKQNQMVLKLLWYYLAILIIPTITTTIIYFTARDALLDVQKEKTNEILTDSMNQFEQDLEGVRNVAMYLSSDRTIIDLALNDEKEKKDTYFEMFQCCEEFPQYTLINSMIGDICIWFRNQQYVMSVPGVYPKTDRAISSLPAFGKVTVEELEQGFLGEYHYMSMHIGKGSNLNSSPVRIIQSLSSSKGNRYDGAVVISLDAGVMNGLLEKIRINDKSSVFLLDDKDKIVRGFTNNEYKIEKPEEVSWSVYKEASNIEKNTYTYRKTSESSKWTFVVVTPMSELTANIGWVKYFMGLLYSLSILAGGLICFYYWYHNKKMINRYCEFVKNLSSEESLEDQNQGFWNSFGGFLEQIENLQSNFVKQEVIIEGECLRKLLFGKYRSLNEFETENRKVADVLKQQKGFSVAVVRFENQVSEDFIVHEKEMNQHVEELFRDVLGFSHWLYALDNKTYALLLYMDNASMLQQAEKELFMVSMKAEEERAVLFVGVSNYVDSIMKLNEAYEAAMGICKSASFFQIHSPLMEREQDKETQTQVMTIEREYEIEKIMLCGTENDLEAMLIQLRESNLEQISQHLWLVQMTNMLQSILIRCLKKSEDEWNQDIIKQTQKAEWPDELFFLLRLVKHHQILMRESRNGKYVQEIKNKLETFVEKNYADANFNLAALAELVDMPEQKLYREFKLYFGMTFSEYLENIRIAQATSMLKAGVAVKDVAAQTGYGSDYSFRRAFKRKTNLTPSAFMKAQQQNP